MLGLHGGLGVWGERYEVHGLKIYGSGSRARIDKHGDRGL